MTQSHPGTTGQTARGQRDTPGTAGPRWEVRTSESGGLTAVLTGFGSPITVTATDPEDLRKQIKAIIFRALL